MDNFNGNPEYNQNYSPENNQNINPVNNQNGNPAEKQEKIMTSNIIGFVLMLVSILLCVLTDFPLFYVGLFVGVFMFASFTIDTSESGFVIANTRTKMIRKRKQILFIPFVIISSICTLGKCVLSIPCKEEYFLSTRDNDGNENLQQIPRSEYKKILAQQREIYAKDVLNPQFVKDAYTLESIALPRKKNRLIIAVVFEAIMLSTLFTPGGIAIVLIYSLLFIPMIILWIPDYKDAKLMHDAYIRSAGNPDHPDVQQ